MLLKRLTTLATVIALSALAVIALWPAPAAAQEAGDFTYVQIAHLSYATGPLEVYIDEELSDIQAVSYGDISGWVELVPGNYRVTFVPADEALDEAVLGPVNYTLEADTWTTLAVIGAPDDDTLALQPLRMDYSEINQGEARVAVFHALNGAPAIDVVLDDGTVLVEDLPYVGADEAGFSAGMATFSIASGTYDLVIVPAGETEPVLLALDDTELEPGTYYFVSVSGTADDAVPVIDSIATEDINALTNASIGEDAPDDETEDADGAEGDS